MIQYAQRRGVGVMVEFDMPGEFGVVGSVSMPHLASVVHRFSNQPLELHLSTFLFAGHAAAWCAGYPEICPSTTCQQPLNVANNATFELIADLLGAFLLMLHSAFLRVSAPACAPLLFCGNCHPL